MALTEYGPVLHENYYPNIGLQLIDFSCNYKYQLSVELIYRKNIHDVFAFTLSSQHSQLKQRN